MALTITVPTWISITWFVNKEGQFVLRVLDAGEKKQKKGKRWLFCIFIIKHKIVSID
jgi:hypothetical protein